MTNEIPHSDGKDRLNQEIFDTLGRERLISYMLETLPPELIPGFLNDELESVRRTIKTVQEALNTPGKLNDIAHGNYTDWGKRLLEQETLILEKQRDYPGEKQE